MSPRMLAEGGGDIDPEVDVVVLTWNDGPLLDTALGSIRASQAVRARVIVVDNASSPPAVVGDDVTLLRNCRNRGVAGGRNQGVSAGSASYVCLLDSDAVLEPDALRQLIDVLKQDGVGIAVPVFAGQRPEQSAGRAPSAWVKVARAVGLTDAYVPTSSSDAPAWDVDFGIGACQVFRRQAWEGVGGIEESYFYGPEDVDFCLRVKDAGWRVLQVAGATVHHPPRRRFRRPLSRRGLDHAWCIVRYLVRHRRRTLLPGVARTAVG